MFIGVRIKEIINNILNIIYYYGLINFIIVLILELIAPIMICILTILLFILKTIDYYVFNAEVEAEHVNDPSINTDQIDSVYCEGADNAVAIKTEFSNNGNSGVYMFLNRINNKKYIGSSINLARRYNSHIRLINTSPLPLYRSIRLYGLENFNFYILEYTAKDIKVCRELEQLYINMYNPEYNILKSTNSSIGFKHTQETISKLQDMHKGNKHPRFGKIVSREQKELVSQKVKKFYENVAHPNKGKKGINAPQYGIGGSTVYCFKFSDNSDFSDKLIFPSINGARVYFKCRFTKISENLNNNE